MTASALKDVYHFIWALMRLDVHIMTDLFGQGVRPSVVVQMSSKLDWW